MRPRCLLPASARNKPNRSSAAVENGMRAGRSGWRARCHAAEAAQTELARTTDLAPPLERAVRRNLSEITQSLSQAAWARAGEDHTTLL